MGYYSNATAVIYPSEPDKSVEDRDKWVAEKVEALKIIFQTYFKEGWEHHWGDCVRFEDDKVVLEVEGKLYDGYVFVESYKEMLNAMHGLGYEYEYVRLGEEDTDVEYECSEGSMGRLQVVRSVEIE